MNFKIFAAPVTALTLAMTGSFISPARAGGCYESLAVGNISNMAAGGASLEEAWNFAGSKGNVVNTKQCFTSVKGYSRSMKNIYPYAYNAFWN